jgi:microcompartment protein CcmK/EutM
MTVVPSIIELQGRFPGLGKVWATTVHERLRYAKQVADQIIDDNYQQVEKHTMKHNNVSK